MMGVFQQMKQGRASPISLMSKAGNSVLDAVKWCFGMRAEQIAFIGFSFLYTNNAEQKAIDGLPDSLLILSDLELVIGSSVNSGKVCTRAKWKINN